MKIIIIAISIIICLIVGEWIYRSFLRPIKPLQPSIVKLVDHFNSFGVAVSAKPVRHGFRYNDVYTCSSIQIKNFPLPIMIDLCLTEEAAIRQLEKIKNSPNLVHPIKNGNMIFYLPMWKNDDPMGLKVKEIFQKFKL